MRSATARTSTAPRGTRSRAVGLLLAAAAPFLVTVSLDDPPAVAALGGEPVTDAQASDEPGDVVTTGKPGRAARGAADLLRVTVDSRPRVLLVSASPEDVVPARSRVRSSYTFLLRFGGEGETVGEATGSTVRVTYVAASKGREARVTVVGAQPGCQATVVGFVRSNRVGVGLRTSTCPDPATDAFLLDVEVTSHAGIATKGENPTATDSARLRTDVVVLHDPAAA